MFPLDFDETAQPFAPASLLTLTHSHCLWCLGGGGVRVPAGLHHPRRHLGTPVTAGTSTHVEGAEEPGYLG